MEQSPTTDDRADEDEDPENRTAQHERAAARLGRLSPSCRLGGTPPPRTSTVAGCARELPRGHVGRRREDVVLWNLVDKTSPPPAQAANQVIMDALQSSRMTAPPYARGYTTHTFDLDTTVDPPVYKNVQDTGVSAPMLADYLDALECLGVTQAAVQADLDQYPYPFASPICK